MHDRFSSSPQSRVILASFAIALVLCLRTSAGAQQRDTVRQVLRVTREQAIREALARNPTLQISREQVAQARARVTQARALPEPSIGASIVGQGGAFRPRSGSESDLSFGITIPFPSKILL